MSALGRRAAFNLATIGASVATGLLLTVVLARTWPKELLGTYLYASWVASTLGLVAAAAFPAVAVRYLAQSLARGEPGRARRLLAVLTLGVTATSFLVVGGAGAIDLSTGWIGLGDYLVPVQLLAVAQAFAGLLAYATQGIGRFDLVLYATLPTSALATVAAALLARGGERPAAVLIALGLGSLALAAALAALLARVVPAGRDGGGPPLGEVRPYFLVVTALGWVDLVVWQRSELVFLRHLGDAADLAHYGTAYTFSTAAVRMAPMALAGVLTPAFAALSGSASAPALGPLLRRAVTVMAALTAPLVVLGLGLGPELLSRVLGPGFAAVHPILPWLVLGLAAGNLSGVASTVFHGFGRSDLLLRLGAGLAVFNLLLDVLLIPGHGAIGAARASAIAQAASLPLAMALVARAFGIPFPIEALGRILAATLTALGLLWLVGPALPGPSALTAPAATLLALAVGLGVHRGLGGWRDLAGPVEVTDPPPPTDPPPEVSVIIPSKNRPDFVIGAIARVAAQPGPRREIIVVDSSDDERTAEALRREHPEARYVRVRGLPHNRHFAKNQGIRLARAPILCFLDDDSFVEPGWLERLLAHYRRPEVGAVGGRILDDVFGQGPTGERVGALDPNGRLHLNFTRHTGQPVEVDHLIGCNMSFRSRALVEVGGFDLAYGGPNFMEETDLCLRVRRGGWRIVFDPDALVHHRNAPRDAGLKRVALDPRGEFWSARSRAYFAWKLLPRTMAVLRYNALGFLKLHALEALRKGSPAHARALVLQALGLAAGTLDWLLAGLPRAGVDGISREDG